MYRKIASTIITDHNLLKVIAKIRIFIDPKVPIFVAAGITRSVPRNIVVSDFAGITVDGEKVILNISDETYLAPFLELLWKRFGQDRVSQRSPGSRTGRRGRS